MLRRRNARTLFVSVRRLLIQDKYTLLCDRFLILPHLRFKIAASCFRFWRW